MIIFLLNRLQRLLFVGSQMLFIMMCWLNPPTYAEQTQYGVNPAKPFTHEIWDDVLQAHVDQSGFINFSQLKAYPRPLNRYLELLENASPLTHPARFPTWRHELAYWLNARNALVLRYTLNTYPSEVSTLMPTGLYAQFRIERLGGRYLPIDALDETILSYREDTRVPLALALTTLRMNSKPLPLEAYDPERVESQVFALESRLSAMEMLQQKPRRTCEMWFLDQPLNSIRQLNANTRHSVYFPPKAITAVDIRFPMGTAKPVLEFCEQFNPKYETSTLAVSFPPPYLLMDIWQIHPDESLNVTKHANH